MIEHAIIVFGGMLAAACGAFATAWRAFGLLAQGQPPAADVTTWGTAGVGVSGLLIASAPLIKMVLDHRKEIRVITNADELDDMRDRLTSLESEAARIAVERDRLAAERDQIKHQIAQVWPLIAEQQQVIHEDRLWMVAVATETGKPLPEKFRKRTFDSNGAILTLLAETPAAPVVREVIEGRRPTPPPSTSGIRATPRPAPPEAGREGPR